MKRILVSLALLISMPALMATGRHRETRKQSLTVTQLFIQAAEKGDLATIEKMLEQTIPHQTLNTAICAAYKNNTAQPTDTSISPYTIIIERLLDRGALPHTSQETHHRNFSR
jgi:hypothetical protein